MITGSVDYQGTHHAASLTPAIEEGSVAFSSRCTCRQPGCAHRVAIGLLALEKFPKLRRRTAAPAAPAPVASLPPRVRRKLEVSPAAAPHAFSVACILKVEATGKSAPSTPAAVIAHGNICKVPVTLPA